MPSGTSGERNSTSPPMTAPARRATALPPAIAIAGEKRVPRVFCSVPLPPGGVGAAQGGVCGECSGKGGAAAGCPAGGVAPGCPAEGVALGCPPGGVVPGWVGGAAAAAPTWAGTAAGFGPEGTASGRRSEEHTSELQSRENLV